MSRKVLNVPYMSQRDNLHEPGRSCGVTSLAMVMHYHGIVGDGRGQLEDYLWRTVQRNGWQLTAPDTLVSLCRLKNLNDRFTSRGALQDIFSEIDQERPLVASGYFTRSGHQLAVIGYDLEKETIVCHDPWGNWSPTGYILNDPIVPVTHPAGSLGRAVEFRFTTWMRLMSPEGANFMWLHRISRDTRQTT